MASLNLPDNPLSPNDARPLRARALPAALRREVLESGPCVYCRDEPTDVDHIFPKSRGGSDDRDNLAPACDRCNTDKLDFTPEEWQAYRVENGMDWPPKPVMVEIGETVRSVFPENPSPELLAGMRAIADRLSAEPSEQIRQRPADQIFHAHATSLAEHVKAFAEHGEADQRKHIRLLHLRFKLVDSVPAEQLVEEHARLHQEQPVRLPAEEVC